MMDLQNPDKPWGAIDGPSPTALSVMGPQTLVLGPSPTILSVLGDAGLGGPGAGLDDDFTSSFGSTSHKSSVGSIYDSPPLSTSEHVELFADSLPDIAFGTFPNSITLVDDGTTVPPTPAPSSQHGTPAQQSAEQPYEDNLCVELDLAPAIPESIIERMSARPPSGDTLALDTPLDTHLDTPVAARSTTTARTERGAGRGHSLPFPPSIPTSSRTRPAWRRPRPRRPTRLDSVPGRRCPPPAPQSCPTSRPSSSPSPS